MLVGPAAGQIEGYTLFCPLRENEMRVTARCCCLWTQLVVSNLSLSLRALYCRFCRAFIAMSFLHNFVGNEASAGPLRGFAATLADTGREER